MVLSDIIKEMIYSSIGSSFNSFKNDIREYIKQELKFAASYILKKAVFVSMIVISFIFLSFSAIYALKEYVGLSNTLSFLLISALLFIIALILGSKAERRYTR